MKFKTLPKLHLVCQDYSQIRPIMNYILVTKDDVVATDAHVLVIHKTRDLFDEHFINKMLQPTSCAGEAMYYLAASPDLEGTTGQYFNMTHIEKAWHDSLNLETGKTLWGVTEKIVGLGNAANQIA